MLREKVNEAGSDLESEDRAVTHRQTCQAQLAPCDPVRERKFGLMSDSNKAEV